MREDSNICKPLEDIMTLQEIDINTNIEENCTDLIDKAPSAAEMFLFYDNNDVDNITKNKIGGILSYYNNKTINVTKEKKPTIVSMLQRDILSFPIHQKVELTDATEGATSSIEATGAGSKSTLGITTETTTGTETTASMGSITSITGETSEMAAMTMETKATSDITTSTTTGNTAAKMGINNNAGNNNILTTTAVATTGIIYNNNIISPLLVHAILN